jgi:tripeptidyl-peptidase I
MKMGMRGLSVMVSSGDAGATNIGHGATQCVLSPQYPASSPWVTTVGATVYTPRATPICYAEFGGKALECSGPAREVAVAADNGMVWTTGGGFSSRDSNPMPAYQRAAVQRYLALNAGSLPNGFNSSNRAYPDVAAVGALFLSFFLGLLLSYFVLLRALYLGITFLTLTFLLHSHA